MKIQPNRIFNTFGLCFQIFSINSDAESLISFYPDAVDHIMAKRRELLRAIEKLDNKVKERDELVKPFCL